MPCSLKPRTWVARKMQTARPTLVLRVSVGARKPGTSEIRFENRMKTKNVPRKGRYLRAFLGPMTPSRRPKTMSARPSKMARVPSFAAGRMAPSPSLRTDEAYEKAPRAMSSTTSAATSMCEISKCVAWKDCQVQVRASGSWSDALRPSMPGMKSNQVPWGPIALLRGLRAQARDEAGAEEAENRDEQTERERQHEEARGLADDPDDRQQDDRLRAQRRGEADDGRVGPARRRDDDRLTREPRQHEDVDDRQQRAHGRGLEPRLAPGERRQDDDGAADDDREPARAGLEVSRAGRGVHLV